MVNDVYYNKTAWAEQKRYEWFREWKTIKVNGGRVPVKRKFICFIFLLIVSCIYPNMVLANSPPLIMKGDTAFPVSSDNIKLESEVIKIHYGATERYGLLGHEIEVLFNSHNIGEETDLDIGFPNVASYAEKLREFEVYDYPSMIPYETEIKNGETLPEHDLYHFNSIYTWKMHFKGNERKSVYVKYKFESDQWGQITY